MKIELTPEQIEQLHQDHYIDLGWGKNRFYIEIDKNGNFSYAEVSAVFDEEDEMKRRAYWFDTKSLQKMAPRKPYDPSYYRNDPLCPSCSAYMIYHFEHCPKCGQKLDWSERNE